MRTVAHDLINPDPYGASWPESCIRVPKKPDSKWAHPLHLAHLRKIRPKITKIWCILLDFGFYPKKSPFPVFFSVPASILGVFGVYLGCIWVISGIFREIKPLFRDLCRANPQIVTVWVRIFRIVRMSARNLKSVHFFSFSLSFFSSLPLPPYNACFGLAGQLES